MVDILVVDDELPVRMALSTLPNWTSLGIRQVLQAENGAVACQLIADNPDIRLVISDLKMPVMDGLDLMAWIQRERSGVAVLILSAWQDYDLVREAFRRGARDYILKTRLEPEALLALVAECLSADGLAAAPTTSVDPIPSAAPDPADRLRRAVMEHQSGVLPSRPVSPLLSGPGSSVLVLWIDDWQTIQKRYQDQSIQQFIAAVTASLRQTLAHWSGAEYLSLSPQEFALLLPWKSTTWRVESRQFWQELRHAFRHYLNAGLSIGLSDPVGEDRGLAAAFREAHSLVQLRHLLGTDRLITSAERNELAKLPITGPDVDAGQFFDQLKAGDLDGAGATLSRIAIQISGLRQAGLAAYHQAARGIVLGLVEHLEACDLPIETLLGDRELAAELAGQETVTGLAAWLDDVGRIALTGLRRRSQTVNSHHVLKARRFIETHYTNPDLGLETVAGQVGLSKFYFSSLFEREMELSFTDYVNRLRIRHAQELLKNSQLRIQEISEACGFNSIEYFSRIFRRLTGSTPGRSR
jgi:two-component system, response regulator YesN